MRNFANLTHGKKLTTLMVALGTLCAANAGFMDLLRGDPASEIPTGQRVAFVGSAKVKEVEGTAEKLVGIDCWEPLRKGTDLTPGDLLRTREGTVLLRMTESGSFVKVTPHTLLRLAELERSWDRGTLSGCEEKKGFLVRSCRGKAYAKSATGDWEVVAVNTVIPAGCEVRTEAGAVVDLYNTEQQRPFRIPGSSQVTLNEAILAKRVFAERALVSVSRP